MRTASLLLLVVALLGAFDIAWFHTRTCHLTQRLESRREAWIHVARGFVYALQMLLVPNVVFGGAWCFAFALLFAVDISIAVADVLEEPRSRKGLGGLPGGEYLAHVVLSVLVGAMLREIVVNASAWPNLPTAITWAPSAPSWLRLALAATACGSFGVAVHEALELLTAKRPRPLHVSVALEAPLEQVWAVTQDPALHPTWDKRFDKITMLDQPIATGSRMLYEKRVFGVTIRGEGRYKLCRHMRQSTFAFGSSDSRSIIRSGVGLWLYERLPSGRTLFSTSYTYEVRWGLLGKIVDLAFRPLFQRETEQSFRRLAKEHFGERRVVAGAAGRKRALLPACEVS